MTDTSTANIINISTTRTYETSSTNSTTTPLNSVNVTPVTDVNNVTSVIQRDTNHLQGANVTSINTENEVKMESNSHTEKTESCSLKERDTKLQEKQSPISSLITALKTYNRPFLSPLMTLSKMLILEMLNACHVAQSP